jgi:tripartite ATP-independent transporter DctM subunit
MIWVLFGVFFLSLLCGLPIAYCLGIASLAYVLCTGIPLTILPQKMFYGIDQFVLLAIPGFILAGNLMNHSGISHRLIDFCKALVGHIRGGLGLTNVGSSMLFAGISGTAVSDTASLGTIMIPAMEKDGYDIDFACAVTATSSTVGPIIPPSLPLIIAGTISGLSVGRLFLAGAVPGLLLGFGLMLMTWVLSVRRGYPKGQRSSIRQVTVKFVDAFWALLMPAFVLFGIVGGVFTPTEASVVAVIYALFVGLFIHRELNVKRIPRIILDSSITTASLMVLVGLANLFGWLMTREQVPQAIAGSILGLTENALVVLLLINVILLIVGAFMETIAALMILFPVLLAVAVRVGVDPVQFAVIAVLNLVIGLTTPPVGVCLFVASSIGKISLGRISRAGLPFLAVSLVVLALVTYVPAISTALPNWVEELKKDDEAKQVEVPESDVLCRGRLEMSAGVQPLGCGRQAKAWTPTTSPATVLLTDID